MTEVLRDPTRKAGAISLGIHLFVLLLLYLLADDELGIVEIPIVIEAEKVVTEREIEKIQKEVQKVRESKVAPEQALRQEQRSSERQSEDDAFTQDFEDMLMGRQTDATEVQQSGSSQNDVTWKQEGTKTTGKKAQGEEDVKVPKGSTRSSNISWEGTYQRKVLRQQKPVYPSYYRRQGIQADVRIRFTVDPSGKVIDVVVTESSGHAKLDINAKNAVRNYRFAPDDDFSSGNILLSYRLTD